MGTLAQVANERRSGLRALRKLSISLDAAQEKVDREVVRLISRKRSIPETDDIARVVELMNGMNARFNEMMKGAEDLLRSFG